MMQSIFITGTDTEIGKTYTTCLLSQSLQTAGFDVIASKPLASGHISSEQHHNEDALLLQQSSSIALDYQTINPFCLALATAPHLAAQHQNMHIPQNFLKTHLRKIKTYQPDYHLVEGAGGWHVPINATQTFGDLVVECELKIILVVGIKLGCINHSLLTARAIQQQQGNLIGWIANCIDPEMFFLQDTIDSIQQRLQAPLLTTINHGEKTPKTLNPLLFTIS